MRQETGLILKQQPLTLVDVLELQAELLCDKPVMTFVRNAEEAAGLSPAQVLTYNGLREQATSIAAALQSVASPGERILILLPPGPDYLASFFGCLYAGMIAVPAYPPSPMLSSKRIHAITRDSKPSVVLSTTFVREACEVAVQEGGMQGPVIAVDQLPLEKSDIYRGNANTVAFLQYTSGSTGEPHGVIVSHGNLIANIAALKRHLHIGQGDRQASWLPPYHDMGLIQGLLQPVVDGLDVVAMTPATFLRNPFSWLRCFDTFKATYGGAPNFAYALCVERVKKEPLEADLSSWRVAFCGAEPIRRRTLEDFEAVFAANGLRSRITMPGYGLAEATLVVTTRELGSALDVARLAPDGSHYEWEAGAGSVRTEDNGTVVAVGTPVELTDIRIVDPSTRTEVADGQVGEIWVSGPTVAQGYWKNDEATETVFRAHLATSDGKKSYLRTGDLGFHLNGQLFVAGRIKDMLILRGQNIYPQDIEKTVEAIDKRFSENRVVAAGLPGMESDDVIVVIGCRTQISEAEVTKLGGLVREGVAAEHGISISDVVFTGRGQILLTSSGKLRRSATRDAYLAGNLKLYGVSRIPCAPLSCVPDVDDDNLLGLIVRAFASVLPSKTADADTNFYATGGDSLCLVELTMILEDEHGITMEPALVSSHPTPRALAKILNLQSATPCQSDAVLLRQMRLALRSPIESAVDENDAAQLSPVQRRWASNYLVDRDRTWGNISWSIQLPFGLTETTLDRAARSVWRRYEALRTRFPGAGPDVQQILSDDDNFMIRKVLIENSGQEKMASAIAHFSHVDAQLTFDLENGPLTRLILVTDGAQASTIVATTHHMVADGWSLSVLDRELRAECARLSGLAAASYERSPTVGYRNYSAWYRNLERSGALKASRLYWRSELDGAPMISPTPASALTSNHFAGTSVRLRLDSETKAGMDRLTEAGIANSATIVMSAFFSALHRELDADDLIVGTPLAGRDRSDLRDEIGMFINNVPIRLKGSDLTSLNTAVPAVKAKLLRAVTHQRWQLDRMAEDTNWCGDAAIDFPFTNIFFSDMSGLKGAPLPGNQAVISPLSVEVRYHMMLYSIRYPDAHVLDLRFRDQIYSPCTAESLLNAVVNGVRKIVVTSR